MATAAFLSSPCPLNSLPSSTTLSKNTFPENLNPFQLKFHLKASSSNTTVTSNNEENQKNTAENDQGSLKLKNPVLDSAIKAPTAPWMKGPLLLEPSEMLDLSKARFHAKKKRDISEKIRDSDRALTDKVSGGRGKKAMSNIMKSITQLQENQKFEDTQKSSHNFLFRVFRDDAEGFREPMPLSRADKIVFGRPKKENGIRKLQTSEDAQKNPRGSGFRVLVDDVDEDENERFRDPMPRSGADTIVFGRTKEEKVVTVAELIKGITRHKENHKLEDSQKNPQKSDFKLLWNEVEEDGKMRSSEPMPWWKAERIAFGRPKKEKVVTAAELNLPEMLLKRLRAEAKKMRKWVKVNKAGVTEAVVEEIELIWRNNELAMLKFGLPLSRNMDRAREIVQVKTGGLVVWSKKDALVVYRGTQYSLKAVPFQRMQSEFAAEATSCSKIEEQKLGDSFFIPRVTFNDTSDTVLTNRIANKEGVERMMLSGTSEGHQSVSGSLYEREADRLLDDLGPRYIDWWMPKPLPVDADMLPEVVPGFKPPFRLCPPDVRPKLADEELTYLRMIARPLPTHFVLGRNKKLQGLAAAILKLWEKSIIAKIAIKWGCVNTDHKKMASELKASSCTGLTGGVLILCNKYFIIFYRGKDFLPHGIAKVIENRESEIKRCQIHEEGAQIEALKSILVNKQEASISRVGTLSEFQNIQTECLYLHKESRELVLQQQTEKEKLEEELRKQERKLFILKMKMEVSAKGLCKLNSAWRPSMPEADPEIITEEERECFRKIGMKMDSCLVLGRCGIFDGVIEGLHQHWKHREVVKVITMQRLYSQVRDTAHLLETESRGILVSIERLKEGHAIILYRGKNYKRPLKSTHMNLLSKRKALQRSLEMQRFGSLTFFASQRQHAIAELKLTLADLSETIYGNQGVSKNLTEPEPIDVSWRESS
ncbi:RNA-binding, CRM domain [Dillenia turbinata]|uniref:RNA-binding, CRM domain n=1 Tax=Dillenia turbinata TaxID=194707 RepID=A0AAN8ZBW2_9MAGN